MKFNAWISTDVGNVKTVNEDSAWALPEQGLFVVADGVSGREAGEVASLTLVREFERRAPALMDKIKERDPLKNDEHREELLRDLVELIDDINGVVYQLGQQPEYNGGIATTVVAMLVWQNAAFVAHVGDSRVYLVRNKKIFRITEDHTYAELLKKQHGAQALPERLSKRYSHVLTRSIGSHPRVDVDVIFFDFYAGDRFLLCTDGLTDYLSGQELLQAMITAPTDRVAQDLVMEAKVRGGRDNITAIFIEVEDSPAHRTQTLPQMDTLKKVDFLGELVLFRQLTTLELLRVLRVVYEQSYADGDTIVSQGQRSDAIYLIVEGSVRVERGGKTLTTLKTGDHFGELSMFDHTTSTVDVISQGQTLVFAVPHQHFKSMIGEDHALGNKLLWNITYQLANHLTHMNQKVTSTP